MIARQTIAARRHRLSVQLAEAQARYEQLETTLRDIDRQLCAMHGGLQELDALLSEQKPADDPPERSGALV